MTTTEAVTVAENWKTRGLPATQKPPLDRPDLLRSDRREVNRAAGKDWNAL